jgi:hypothetical protein
MLAIILFILFIIALQLYAYLGLRASLFSGSGIFQLTSILSAVLIVAGLVMMMTGMRQPEGTGLLQNLLFGMAFSLIMANLLMTAIFFTEDILRGFLWLFQSAVHFRPAQMISRSFVAGTLALGIAFLTFVLVNYGVWFGRYQFRVHHQLIQSEKLPESFDGFTIAHISDLHLGTFDQQQRVQKGFDLLMQQKPDLILFSGDMVNNRAEEAVPYVEMLAGLKAPYGKFSVMGNHDYGDYVDWKTPDEKNQNVQFLRDIQHEMGFRQMKNEHLALARGGDTIYLAGVENWGKPPFPQHGDLQKALDGLTSNDFVVLLSHDPSHWREQVVDSGKADLTLSGHTHGMQFGIELGQFKWSPVKYRYPEWAGLFSEGNKHLYVNRGFGSIGYPGRVGIWPEITLIELRSQ